MSEKTIETKIKNNLKAGGIWFIKVHGSQYQQPGVPDLICCYRGMFLAIEVKQPGKRLTEIQCRMCHRMVTSGAWIVTARCWEDVEEVLGKMDSWAKRHGIPNVDGILFDKFMEAG